MNKLMALFLALILAAAGVTGCTKKDAEEGETPPPASQGGDSSAQTPDASGGNAGGEQTDETAIPALVQNYLQQGQASADGLWVAALVPPGENAETAGVWVAPATELTQASRITQAVSSSSGTPIWTPTGGLLFADVDGTWQLASPPNWQVEPFLPELFAGRNISIRADAFSPDGTQFIYTDRVDGHNEIWLASITGEDIRHLGTDIAAAWVNGELVTAEAGK